MSEYGCMRRVRWQRSGMVGLLFMLSLGGFSCGDVAIEQSGREAAHEAMPPAEEGAQNMSVIRQAAGEPVHGYPNYEERVLLYLTNRTRSEPSAFRQDITYPPSGPLRYDVQLSKAARWFAEHFIKNSACWCEDHSSCCEMGGTGDAIQCAGPVTGCGVTSAASRVGEWSSKYAGENMAKGQRTPLEAIEGWISSDGHWQNMNEPSFTLLGPGNYQTGWVQDFGRDGQPRPVAEDGIHFGSGANQTFASMYYQLGSGGPRTALVIVDGECHELNLKYGTPEHGAFEKTLNLAPGCHRYYFHFTDGNGEEHVYPTMGSLGVGVGAEGANCPLFEMSRQADTCSPSGQPCVTGQTRKCYTGPYGTADVGICASGSERCQGGKWTGVCNRQVLPEPVQSCGKGIDDNCDGQIDEGCPVIDIDPPDAGEPDAGDTDTEEDAGQTADQDVEEEDDDQPTGESKRDGGGCAVAGSHRGEIGPIALVFGGVLLCLRRRRLKNSLRR